MAISLLVAALAVGSVHLDLTERDRVDFGTAAKLMDRIRSAIERRTNDVIAEGSRGSDCTKSRDCTSVQVHAFGGPLHIHVIFDRASAGGEAPVHTACDVPNDHLDRWAEVLAGAIDVLFDGWSRPPPTLPAVQALPPSSATGLKTSIVPGIALGGVAVGASVAAVGFALGSKSARNELGDQRYGASEYDGLVSSMRRDQMIAEVCVGAAIASAAALVIYFAFIDR
jgi:hypothetical protein